MVRWQDFEIANRENDKRHGLFRIQLANSVEAVVIA